MIVIDNLSGLSEVYLGDNSISEVYVGDNNVWTKDGGEDMNFLAKRIHRDETDFILDCTKSTASYNMNSGLTSSEISGETSSKNPVAVVFGDCCQSINSSACWHWKYLTSVTFSDSVTSIDSYAFSDTSLETAHLPKNLLSIGTSSFSYNSKLVSITIPDSVESVGDFLFTACDNFTSVVFGSGIKSMGQNLFFQTPINSVTVKSITPPSINNSFNLTPSTMTIYVPSESLNAYKTASGWSTYASQIQAIP